MRSSNDDCVSISVGLQREDDRPIADAYRTRQLALELGTAIGAVVVNWPLQTSRERLAHAPAPVLERRAAIARSLAAGRPLRVIDPNDDGTTTFEAIARTIERSGARLDRAFGDR